MYCANKNHKTITVCCASAVLLDVVGCSFVISGGRRENVTLGKILQFVSGRDTEPLLGFTMTPSVTFTDGVSMPMANTCTCHLRMPLLTDTYEWDLLDLAFANEFFGQI